MAARKPQEGDVYTLNAEAEAIGVDAGALVPGTTVTVREVVPAAEPGAHDDSEDAVVVEWGAPSLVRGENGVEVGESPRAMSFGLDDFTNRFTKEG